MKVVNETAPSKEIWIKNNTQKWFDRKIPELIHACKKLFLKFNLTMKFKILLGKKSECYETNLRQKTNKHKELWKTLKSTSLPSKAVKGPNICSMPQKTAPPLKIIFNVLHKTWYLSCLFYLIFLLNPKLHPTMTITQCQEIWIFNF